VSCPPSGCDSRAATPPLPIDARAAAGSASRCASRECGAERKALLEMYGAEVIFTDPLDGSDGASRRPASSRHTARRVLVRRSVNHPATRGPHYVTTAEEIWRQPAAGHASRAGLARRDPDGNRPAFKRVEPRGRARRGATRRPVPRPGGVEASRDGDRAGHLRSGAAEPDGVVATEDAEEVVRRLRNRGVVRGVSSGAAIVRGAGCRPGSSSSSLRTRTRYLSERVHDPDARCPSRCGDRPAWRGGLPRRGVWLIGGAVEGDARSPSARALANQRTDSARNRYLMIRIVPARAGKAGARRARGARRVPFAPRPPTRAIGVRPGSTPGPGCVRIVRCGTRTGRE